MVKQRSNPSQQTSEIGYAETSTPTTGVTNASVVDLTGLSTTVTVPNGATLVIEGWIPQIYSSVSGDRNDLYIREGATSLAIAYAYSTVSSQGQGGAYVRKRIQPSAGSHTYKISLIRGAGSGSLSTYCDSTTLAHMQVRIV